MFVIREAVPQDATGVAGVHVTTWRAAYKGLIPDDFLARMTVDQRAQRFLEFIAEPSLSPRCFVAEKDGKIIGNLMMGKHGGDDSGKTGEVMAIYVLPAFWGQGYGKQMMDFAIGRLTEAGYRTLVLWTLEGNARARRFYESAGFTFTGQTRELDFGKPVTVVEYARTSYANF